MEVVSTENGTKKSSSVPPVSKNVYWLQTFQSSLNLLAHIMIGFVVGANLIYSFRSGLPLRTTPIHIVLCVIGYQLLMAESILSLCPYNGWSAHLRLVDKKRAHWVLQIVGSALAIAGTVIMSMSRRSNWNSLHGKFALVAFVFTTVSLVNGVASLYAYEIRKVVPIPGKLSKVTHILFGIVAFASATISLCYGYEYVRSYFGDGMTEALIALTAAFTAIILINPCITLVVRIMNK